MNSWDDEEFREAIRATGKKNNVIAGLWMEVCAAWPTLKLLNEGYKVYVVEDACGANYGDGITPIQWFIRHPKMQ